MSELQPKSPPSMAGGVLRQWLPLSTLLSLWDDKSGFGSTQCLLAKSRAFTCLQYDLGQPLNILSIKVGVTSMTLLVPIVRLWQIMRWKNLNCEV